MLVSSTKPVWQTQLWTEQKQGLKSQSVLLFIENSTLPLASPSEAASGKPQSTYPPTLFENAMASIQTQLCSCPDASEMPFVACWRFTVAFTLLEANLLAVSPPEGQQSRIMPHALITES